MTRLRLPAHAALATLALVSLGMTRLPAAAAPEPGIDHRQELEDRLKRAELLAGLTPVEGAGVLITLRHSPRVVRGADRDSLMIHEKDVSAVLNALRLAGAEAIAVGGGNGTAVERITGVTALADGMSSLLVNGVPLQPPYRILAVGDPAALRAELYRPDGVIRRAGLDALQMVEVLDSRRLELPPARVIPAFRYAQAVPESFRIARRPPVPGPGTAPPTPAPAAPTRPAAEPAAPAERPQKPEPKPEVKPEPKPETRPEPKPEVQPEPPVPVDSAAAQVKGAVFGGKGLAKYHVPGCRFGERLPAADRLQFRTAADAEKGGRVPCRICIPVSRG